MGLGGLLGSLLPAWGWIPELGREDTPGNPFSPGFSLKNPRSPRATGIYPA